MFMAGPDAGSPSASIVTSVASVATPFPIEALPPVMRQMVEEVAAVASVPPSLPGCQAVAIIGAALGSGFAVYNDRGSYTYGNLYLVVAAESGTGKSVTFTDMMAPVYGYQDELRKKAQASHANLQAELFRLRLRLKGLKADEVNITDEELAELISRQREISDELQKWPKVICEDVTEAKLQVILATNKECIFSASADARQVIHAVLSGKGDSLYTKCWSGDSTDVDRISRREVPLRAPRISILWCPQPDLLMEMFTKRVLTDNGFLPRVLPCLIEAAPMPIGTEMRSLKEQTREAWDELVDGLLSTYHRRSGQPFIANRTTGAQERLVSYYNEVVARRQGELADVGPYAARWAEQAWRLSVVLHAATHGHMSHKASVNEQTARNAITLMKFFSNQQLDLLRRSRNHARTETELAVLDALSTRHELTVRDVQLGSLRSLNADTIRKVMEDLVAAGKLTSRIQKTQGGGHDKILYFLARDTRDTRDNPCATSASSAHPGSEV